MSSAFDRSVAVQRRRPGAVRRPEGRLRPRWRRQPGTHRPPAAATPSGVPARLVRLVCVPRPKPGVLPAEPSGPSRDQHRMRSWPTRLVAPSGRQPWRGPGLVGLAALAVLLGVIAWPQVDRPEASDAAVQAGDNLPSDPGSGLLVPADGASDEAGIGLPPPWGTTPRDRPLQTLLLIDHGAWELAADTIRDEATVVVEYLATYAIAGDGLGIGLTTPRRVLAAAEQLTVSLEQPLLAPPATPGLAEIQQVLDPYLDDHRAVVVVTTQPDRWEHLLALNDTRGATVSEAVRTPRTSSYLIELTSTAPTFDPDRPIDRLPHESAVDPERTGHLAHALARAWVESYRGGWDAQSNAPRGGR